MATAKNSAAKPAEDDENVREPVAAAKPVAGAAKPAADAAKPGAAAKSTTKPGAAATKPATATKSSPAQKSTSAQKAAAADQQIVFDPAADRSAVAQQAIANPVILGALVENLSTETRRIRQFSAAALKVISESAPEILVAHIPQIADALHRPEAQTRWECLEVLIEVVSFDPESCDDAVIGAEGSLYDEESGTARLAAVRFLSAYGSLDAKRSARVWPLLDEAIQCYHGDPEFQDMLISIIAFAGGRISKDVRSSLASRMSFDAANGKGVLKRRATQIVELCKK